MKIISDEEMKEYLSDVEDWETGDMGKNPKYARSAPEYAKKATSIRLTESMLLDLREIALDEAIPYQTLVKSVLSKYIRTKKKQKIQTQSAKV